MPLTFHDCKPTPRTTPALLSVRRDGAITLNSAGAGQLQQQKGGLVTLVSDERQQWFLHFGPLAGHKPFEWKRQSGGNGTSALQFFSGLRAGECLAAHHVTDERLYLEVLQPAEQHEGYTLYRLHPTRLHTGAKAPAQLTKAPDEATLYRLNETVRALGGMRLDRQAESKLTQALGLLQAHEAHLGGIAGAETLLAKLRHHLHA